jgi:hypothetical protein
MGFMQIIFLAKFDFWAKKSKLVGKYSEFSQDFEIFSLLLFLVLLMFLLPTHMCVYLAKRDRWLTIAQLSGLRGEVENRGEWRRE